MISQLYCGIRCCIGRSLSNLVLAILSMNLELTLTSHTTQPENLWQPVLAHKIPQSQLGICLCLRGTTIVVTRARAAVEPNRRKSPSFMTISFRRESAIASNCYAGRRGPVFAHVTSVSYHPDRSIIVYFLGNGCHQTRDSIGRPSGSSVGHFLLSRRRLTQS